MCLSQGNYFLSNILLQSLSQSAGGILQLFPRLTIYALSNGTKKLAREKFSARTNLRTMDWGTTYPLYTTLACIALIYSVIAPMILPLTIFGFGVWWISTRYQMLYVFRYTVDTGGLLFPEAHQAAVYGSLCTRACSDRILYHRYHWDFHKQNSKRWRKHTKTHSPCCHYGRPRWPARSFSNFF